jgi:hypothetical protein
MQDEGGAGLAAPQLGVGLRVFAFDVDDVVGHIVNPVLTFPTTRSRTAGGLPVHPRRLRRHQAPAERRRAGLQRARRPDPAGRHRPDGPLRAARDRPPRRRAVPGPAGRRRRKDAMKQIRAAEWYDAGAPPSQGSPHGAASSGWGGDRCACLRRHPGRRLPSLDAIAASGTSSSPWSPAPTRRPARAAAGPLARRRVGRRARHRGAHPAAPREPEFQSGCGARARLRAGGRVRRAGAAERAGDPQHGWVNLHFSLLPAWRGAAPVQHAVLHGDEVTGASVFELEAGWTPARSTAR